jgi:arabinan endo-1,5-alpha-L-arabinosidase
MLWSSFGDDGYAMGIADSTSGSILGPWTQRSEPLWARNGGHGMILRTTDRGDYLVFHSPNETPHERTKVLRLEQSDETCLLGWPASTTEFPDSISP